MFNVQLDMLQVISETVFQVIIALVQITKISSKIRHRHSDI